MRKYLTIGEVSNLLDISTSSIRFYEKEGLLSPFKIDENGYRLYDFNELDTLETILLLRKMDVPLKQLRKILHNNSIEDYLNTLNESLKSLDNKIDQLNKKKQYVQRKIEYIHNYTDTKNSYSIINLPQRNLSCIHTGTLFEYSPKCTYELTKSLNISYSDMFQDSYVIRLDDNNYSFCVDSSTKLRIPKNNSTLVLPKGSYLNYNFFSNMPEMFDEEINNFYEYMKKHNLTYKGNLIIIENTRFSDFYLNAINLNLQIQIVQ